MIDSHCHLQYKGLVEDQDAGTDANFVMTGKGGIVEIQGTAEGEPFTEAEFGTLLGLLVLIAWRGIAARRGQVRDERAGHRGRRPRRGPGRSPGR